MSSSTRHVIRVDSKRERFLIDLLPPHRAVRQFSINQCACCCLWLHYVSSCHSPLPSLVVVRTQQSRPTDRPSGRVSFTKIPMMMNWEGFQDRRVWRVTTSDPSHACTWKTACVGGLEKIQIKKGKKRKNPSKQQCEWREEEIDNDDALSLYSL